MQGQAQLLHIHAGLERVSHLVVSDTVAAAGAPAALGKRPARCGAVVVEKSLQGLPPWMQHLRMSHIDRQSYLSFLCVNSKFFWTL